MSYSLARCLLAQCQYARVEEQVVKGSRLGKENERPECYAHDLPTLYAYTFADILSASYRNFRGDLRHVNVRVWVFCYDDPCTELSHSSTRRCTAEPRGGSAFHSSGPSIVLSLPYGLTATWHLQYSWLRLRYLSRLSSATVNSTLKTATTGTLDKGLA